jgi:hypothetical protein
MCPISKWRCDVRIELDRVKFFKGIQVMTKNHALSDVVTKAAYFSLTAAAFIFVSMLLLTGLHP